ncbi:hypothetical protein GG344DRAFT_79369 [Lentinula edodes]|nr:hypothetical protein GG344DRAFT_79369 [Lentinula edodes]
MGPKRVTPRLKSARRSIMQATSAPRQHPMITRSKIPRTPGPDAISAPLSSISAANATGVDCTFTLDIHPISAASATAMDSTSFVNIDSIVLPPSGPTTSSSSITIPVLPSVLSDDNCDDNFHGEVETYLDYTSDLLKAQAEEVKLLRREVASAREEKYALKARHEADVTARKEEYRCPICFELLWDPYV